MNTGKLVRLNRIFGHASGRLCSVAVDHFMTYPDGLPEGLRDLPTTLKLVVKGRPDAVTMQIGIARNLWPDYAGVVPMILQASLVRTDDSAMELAATPEDAVRLGADAYALVCFVRGPTEAAYMRAVAGAVREAERYDMPVICHTYPRIFAAGSVRISYAPEDIAWAARCAIELGVDLIKVPYCGNIEAYRQIVSTSPVRIVAAGRSPGRRPEKLARDDGRCDEERGIRGDHRPQHLGLRECDGERKGIQGRDPRRHER